MTDFLQIVKERVVVYDGAMGTNIQTRNPTLDDYWGKENCSEVLVLWAEVPKSPRVPHTTISS
jgi:5-methyltetrahydrofolate--homocysteine methyltransferase